MIGIGKMNIWSAIVATLAALQAIPAAKAYEVYPGCSVPSGKAGQFFHIDPTRGSDDADGSAAHPWKTLQAVVGSVNGASPKLSTVPYNHVGPDRVWAITPNPDAPVKPGDTILLASGQYGELKLSVWGSSIDNSEFVTIGAEPGATPVLAGLYVGASSKWIFRDLKFQAYDKGGVALIIVDGQSVDKPARDIIFQHNDLSTEDSAENWTLEFWNNKARNFGLTISGDSRPAHCVAFTDNLIHNVRFGAGLFGNETLFKGNRIDNFGDDAIDYGGFNLIMQNNVLTNSNTILDGIHTDFMQGQAPLPGPDGAKKNGNIVIDSNIEIRQTNPRLQFPGPIQGIDAFDGDWSNVVVTNNVVITSSCWGIGYYNLHDSKIINNTVVDDGGGFAPNCTPQVGVFDKAKGGWSSNNVLISNNIGPAINATNQDKGVILRNNICANGDHVSGGSYQEEGTQRWVKTPGTYDNKFIIATPEQADLFVNFDPSKFAFDVHLKPGSIAEAGGSREGMPEFDIEHHKRDGKPSVGAYAAAEF